MANKFEISYSHMKAIAQNVIRENFYFGLMLACDEMMFTYSGLPPEIDPKYLEDYLNITGSAAVQKKGDKFFLAPYAGLTGEIDQYGDGTMVKTSCVNGENIFGVRGEDVVIIWNTSARMPQADLIMDADAFSQIDKSSGVNVKLASIAPVFAVANDTQKTALEGMLQQIIDGDPKVFTSENVLSEFGGDRQLEMLDVTHPEKIQYLQYLSEYYDVRMRRHFSRRGLAMRTSSKHAQVGSDEVHGIDCVSWYLPLNKLQCRRDGVSEINRIWGTNISVSFSELWQAEYDAYVQRLESQEGVNDNDVLSDGNMADDLADGSREETADAAAE